MLLLLELALRWSEKRWMSAPRAKALEKKVSALLVEGELPAAKLRDAAEGAFVQIDRTSTLAPWTFVVPQERVETEAAESLARVLSVTLRSRVYALCEGDDWVEFSDGIERSRRGRFGGDWSKLAATLGLDARAMRSHTFGP